jgi:hypothetical protein
MESLKDDTNSSLLSSFWFSDHPVNLLNSQRQISALVSSPETDKNKYMNGNYNMLTIFCYYVLNA